MVSWGAAFGRKSEETPSTVQDCDDASHRGRPLATDRNDTSRGSGDPLEGEDATGLGETTDPQGARANRRRYPPARGRG